MARRFFGGTTCSSARLLAQRGPANRVILVWTDDPPLSTNRASVRKDAIFAEFNRLLWEEGVGQSRYRVLADFEGRLGVAQSTGLKREPKSKKVVRLEGFGHPMPFTRFRLISTGVSRIVQPAPAKR